MKDILRDLLAHLELERLEVNLFRGESRDIGSERVFGGQVLAQALKAAMLTLKSRHVHSLHAYFLRPGDVNAPIVYDVDRARDGLSFSMRRVVAVQHGHQIFNLSASFQRAEDGLEHQVEMPQVAAPETLTDATELAASLSTAVPQRLVRFFSRQRPFEFRLVETPDFDHPQRHDPVKHVWFRAVDSLPDDNDLHNVLLAYASDFHLVTTALHPHEIAYRSDKVQMASLDHGMWFHRPVRVDDWLLYAMDSPSSSGARGLARGQIFARDGSLVASTAQEGLIRLWKS
ncbi:MAG: acyl-CoA thioesterase II [Gammaproteobacteria bacterium]